MLFALAAQVDDGLEQQPETVVVQGLENGFHRVAFIQAFVFSRVVNQDAIAALVAFLLFHFGRGGMGPAHKLDRKSTRLNSSHVKTSYAVFFLKITTIRS